MKIILYTTTRTMQIPSDLEQYDTFLQQHNFKFVKLIEHVTFPIIEYMSFNGDHVVIKVLDWTNGDAMTRSIIENETDINVHLKQNVRKDHYKHIMVADLLCDEANGVFFIIMERMSGTMYSIPTNIFLKNSNQIVSKILKCVHTLHTYGIVHSDLKPDNIFYVKENGKIRIKLGDFGLSSNFESPFNDTTSGSIVPQELLDTNTMKDFRNIDYLQLGATLYTMFTGDRMFFGNQNPTEHSINQAIDQLNNKFLSRFLSECVSTKTPDQSNTDIVTMMGPFLNNTHRCNAMTTKNRKCKKKGRFFGYCRKHMFLKH
jgi:serine/threonine protein kinase